MPWLGCEIPWETSRNLVLNSSSSSHFQSLLRLPRKISVQDRNHALVGLYIKQVLVQLNYTLINKSDAYGDQVWCAKNAI